MFKKLIFSLVLFLFASSCGNTLDSVKRGLTGTKQKSTDEFLVEKKDPLILPPNFDELPMPSGRNILKEEVSSFEKKLKKISEGENEILTTGSAEKSILEEIKKR